jgi:hypothetical protein
MSDTMKNNIDLKNIPEKNKAPILDNINIKQAMLIINDKSIDEVKNILIQFPELLEYTNSIIAKDKKFIEDLLKKYPLAIKFASDEIKKDKEICLMIIKKNENACLYIDKSLLKNENFMNEAIEQNPKVNFYADYYIQKINCEPKSYWKEKTKESYEKIMAI